MQRVIDELMSAIADYYHRRGIVFVEGDDGELDVVDVPKMLRLIKFMSSKPTGEPVRFHRIGDVPKCD